MTDFGFRQKMQDAIHGWTDLPSGKLDRSSSDQNARRARFSSASLAFFALFS
ncbi:unnamed protein product, partial [Fusarium graminearum]